MKIDIIKMKTYQYLCGWCLAIIVDGGQYRIGRLKIEKMNLSDQDKMKIARVYFIRAGQRRPDVLDLFHEDVEN